LVVVKYFTLHLKTGANNMKVTANELLVLEAILNSEYQNSDQPDELAGNPVWTSHVNPFKSKPTFSGVVSSLCKKGLIGSQKDIEGDIIWLTQEGVNLLID
jgi:hypothetical protein